MVRFFPRSRRFRFSLASVLIVTTALAIFIGLWSASARNQRFAVAKLEALGAGVTYDGDLEDTIYPTWLTDRLGIDYFLPVVRVSLVKPYEFQYSNYRFGGYRPRVLPEEHWGEPMDEKISAIRQLNHVHQISINHDIRDSDLARFAPLAGQITKLNLNFSNNEFTGTGLKHLADWPRIKTLVLELGYLEAGGFESIGKINALEHLSIKVRTPVPSTDSTEELPLIPFSQISKLPNLIDIELRDLECDGRSLAQLSGSPKLRKITLVNCYRRFKYVGTADPEVHPLKSLNDADMRFLLGLVGGYQSYAQSKELLQEMDRRFEKLLEEHLPQVEIVEINK